MSFTLAVWSFSFSILSVVFLFLVLDSFASSFTAAHTVTLNTPQDYVPVFLSISRASLMLAFLSLTLAPLPLSLRSYLNTATALFLKDTYFIILGLLASGMTSTAEGIVLNLLYLVEQYGFVPNGEPCDAILDFKWLG